MSEIRGTRHAPDADLVERIRRRLAASAESIDAAVRDSSGIADDAALARLSRTVTAELVGAGPLEPLLALAGVTDVLVNGANEVWIDRDGLELTSVRFADDDAVRRLAHRLAAVSGRRLDDASPFVDAVLPDGTRLHAILPPLAERPTVSLRVLARRRFDMRDLIVAGAFDAPVAELLASIVAARLAFVISGSTGSGKSTLLGALLSTVAPNERIVLIEDAPEVAINHRHVIRLLCRTANVEGAGAVGPAELVRQALRMRPDRLVVGEFRGVEFAELLAALNTGHDGGAATVHANSVRDLSARFAALGALRGLTPATVHAQVVSAFQVVIQLGRERDGRRRVREIAVFTSGADGELRSVWDCDPAAQRPGRTELARLILERGVDVPELLR